MVVCFIVLCSVLLSGYVIEAIVEALASIPSCEYLL